MIAHVAGVPFEETIPQLAPMVVAAVVALRLSTAWGRSRMRRVPRHVFRLSTLVALVIALTALAWSADALAEPGRSAATVTGTFSDRCRDFAAYSSKDISHVELHRADGRVVKLETIATGEYAVDGAAGDELQSAAVKSGTTTQTFTCPATDGPPTAILELATPPLEGCVWFPFPEYPTCLETDARTVWSRPSGGALAFLVEAPYPSTSMTVQFRGASSTDADDDIVSWSIDFGDGTSTGGGWTIEPTDVVHTFACCGSPTVTLHVVDSGGRADSDAITLHFIDVTPD